MFSNLSSEVSFVNKSVECLFILYIGVGCDRIDFVESFSHLGNIINAKQDVVSDIISLSVVKTFIGLVDNFLCY